MAISARTRTCFIVRLRWLRVEAQIIEETRSVQGTAFHDAAVDAAERMRHDERLRIQVVRDLLHPANLEPRDNAIQNLALLAALAAGARVDRHAAAEPTDNLLPNPCALGRDDRDRCIFFDAVDHEVQRTRR